MALASRKGWALTGKDFFRLLAHQAGKRRKKTGRKSSTEKALLGYLKQHLSNDFSNPTRIGWPPLEALERNAKDPIHADESVSKHVGHLSWQEAEYVSPKP